MKFMDRKEFLYNPEVFTIADTQTALKIHSEYIRKHSQIPFPRFFEVDRRIEKIDTLWHQPLDDRTVFSRVIDMPALVQKERPDWRMTRVGLVPQQKNKFWVGNLLLQEFDYFPQRGDNLYHDGYRHMIVNVVLEPQGYWQQTNVWLGLICETIIPADGDARPVINPGNAVTSERLQVMPEPEI